MSSNENKDSNRSGPQGDRSNKPKTVVKTVAATVEPGKDTQLTYKTGKGQKPFPVMLVNSGHTTHYVIHPVFPDSSVEKGSWAMSSTTEYHLYDLHAVNPAMESVRLAREKHKLNAAAALGALEVKDNQFYYPGGGQTSTRAVILKTAREAASKILMIAVKEKHEAHKARLNKGDKCPQIGKAAQPSGAEIIAQFPQGIEALEQKVRDTLRTPIILQNAVTAHPEPKFVNDGGGQLAHPQRVVATPEKSGYELQIALTKHLLEFDLISSDEEEENENEGE